MDESHGGGGRLAQSGHVGLVFARGCLRPPFRIGVGSRGSIDSFFGWLTGLCDVPMGPSPRVMNSMYTHMYMYIYIWLRYSSPISNGTISA
jgi:hypothetical protein